MDDPFLKIYKCRVLSLLPHSPRVLRNTLGNDRLRLLYFGFLWVANDCNSLDPNRCQRSKWVKLRETEASPMRRVQWTEMVNPTHHESPSNKFSIIDYCSQQVLLTLLHPSSRLPLPLLASFELVTLPSLVILYVSLLWAVPTLGHPWSLHVA